MRQILKPVRATKLRVEAPRARQLNCKVRKFRLGRSLASREWDRPRSDPLKNISRHAAADERFPQYKFQRLRPAVGVCLLLNFGLVHFRERIDVGFRLCLVRQERSKRHAPVRLLGSFLNFGLWEDWSL